MNCRISLLVVAFAATAPLFADEPAAAESPLNGAVVIKSQEAVDATPLVAVTNTLPWASAPLKTDGDISKWTKLGIKPYVLAGDKYASSLRGTYGGPSDLAADVYLARDFDNLYIGIKLTDDLPPAPGHVEVAFVDAKTPLVVGWRDVGQRNFADDVVLAFSPQADGSVKTTVYKSQNRMDSGALQLACGSETERRAQLDEGTGVQGKAGKMYAFENDGFLDILIPWRTLQPIDPVGMTPFKMNLLVTDRDGNDGQHESVVAFSAGLYNVFSGYHFPVYEMSKPPQTQVAAVRAQIPDKSYLMKDVPFDVSVWTAKPFKGEVVIEPAIGGEKVANASVNVEADKPSTIRMKVDSEKLPEGDVKFNVKLVDESGKTVATRGVIAPTGDDSIKIYHKESIVALVDELKADAAAYSNIVERLESKGLNTVYPRAWLAMLYMFTEGCEYDLKQGDTERVIRNTSYLKGIYAKAVDYANRVMADKSRQWIVPQDDPAELSMHDGYYWAGDRPVFLWGPCLFWYLRKDAHYTWELGFNSVCPELTQSTMPKDELERQAYMKEIAGNGLHVNAAVRVPDLQLTGADVRASKLLRDSPDVKNLDQNNFMSFIVQHPAVKEAVKEGQKESVAFWNRYPGVGTFWLWNEPWYLNYSERTRQDFITEMKKKYRNDVNLLNKRWKSEYKSFDDIQLIQWPDPKNYAPWYDFQCFRDDLLFNFFKFLHDNTKNLRGDLPTHVKFMSPSLASFDLERFQEPYEIIGRDGNGSDRDNIYIDLFRSIAHDKPVVDTEVHIWYGGDAIVNGVAWKMALHGLADGNWWCWHSNPRFSDSIRNAQSMNALVMSGLDIRRLFADYIHPAVEKQTPFATFFPSICERRTDVKIVRMRSEICGAEYSLGYRPDFVTERTIMRDVLKDKKILFAGESMYVKEGTFAKIRSWVQEGGTLLTVKNGFNSNEYGDERNTSSLIPVEGGKPYGEGMTEYVVGKGRVITIDGLELLPDPVDNGGQALSGGGSAENQERRNVYRAALAAMLEKEGLTDDVRLVQPGDDSLRLLGYDWRAVKLADGAYSLVVAPGSKAGIVPVQIDAKRGIKRVHNMVDDVAVYEAPSGINPLNWGKSRPLSVTLPMDGYTKVYRIELE